MNFVKNELHVKVDGKKLFVPRDAYIKSKTKQLKGFGYSNLTEKEVSDQVDALIAGKKIGAGLTVIGAFMEDEILST